jgi:hypothetical protein
MKAQFRNEFGLLVRCTLIFQISIALFLLIQNSANAGVIASDNAGNYSSWGSTSTSASQASDGAGFGSWSFVNTVSDANQNGSFLGTTANNNNSGNINSGNGNVWGLYANNGQIANATAPFQQGAMTAGQMLSVQMQNGSVNGGGSVGFSLRDGAGANIFEFYFKGGGNDYVMNIWNSGTAREYTTSVGFTSGGLNLAFSQGSGDSWSFSITPIGGSTTTYTSATTGDFLWESSISEIRFFDGNAGSGSGNNVYFNNLELVPEPANFALGIFGGLFGVIGLVCHLKKRSITPNELCPVKLN